MTNRRGRSVSFAEPLGLSALALAVAAALASAEAPLEVTVLGTTNDSRVVAVKEAVEFWNRELDRVGAQLRLGRVRIVDNPIPDQVLRDLSATVMDGHNARGLAERIDRIPGEIVVALSNADLVSFGLP